MAQWQLRHLGETSGPYSWEELRFLAARGKIVAGDEVRAGAGWMPVASVRGLLDTSPSSPAANNNRPAGTSPATATGVQRPTAPPSRPPPPTRLPPPLPAESRSKQPLYVALGALAALLLLLVFWAALQSGGGTANDGDGSGAGNGGQLAGLSEQGNAASGAGSKAGLTDGAEDELAGNSPAPAANEAEPADDQAELADGAEPADGGGVSELAADEPPAPEGVPDGDEEGESMAGTSSDRLPPSAAVIRPLDDDAALGAESGGESGGAVGAAGGSAEFFQVRGKGRRFVYVVDCSGSMSGDPFEKARGELVRSIDALKSGQSFFVIFFDSAEYPQPGGKFVRGRSTQKRAGRQWVTSFAPPGLGTDPEAALMRALRLKPDAIYLLTDGEFDPTIADRVRLVNTHHTAIHTISFMTRVAEPLLQLIARQNDGSYRFVP